MEKKKLQIVTEIGNFGEMNIADPTTMDVVDESLLNEDGEVDLDKLAEKIKKEGNTND